MLEITSSALAAVHAQAVAAGPCECCGLLLGEVLGGGALIAAIAPAANIAAQPRTRFEIDPAALIAAHRAARTGGPQVVGYYHSHPRGACAPSPTDRARAGGDGRVWAIVAAGTIGFWRDTADGFAALSWREVAG